MDTETRHKYWARSAITSLAIAPWASAIIGWLASLTTTGFEGASGYTFLYVALFSLPITITAIIFLLRHKKVPFYLPIILLIFSLIFASRFLFSF